MLYVEMSSFISVSGSCSFFLNTVVLFRRDIRKKKRIFYPGTDSFKTRNLDKPSVDYIIQIYVADANGMTRFGHFGSRFLISSPPKNVHIKVLTFRHLAIGSNSSASRFEFVMIKAFVCRNAGKVPN